MKARKAVTKSELQELLLAQFESGVAVALIEFAKRISALDVDYLLFMARKSYCLFDTLMRLGIATTTKQILSDRVLDQELRSSDTGTGPLCGKRIALIDDTVIVGTTLARAKQRLVEKADAAVSVHALCVDRDSWSDRLITLDTVELTLNKAASQTLSAAEVRVLSLFPRPYMVDFPICRGLKFPTTELQTFLSSVEWSAYSLTTPLQAANDVLVYTLVPDDAVLHDIQQRLGQEISSCIDILKVRAFGRRLGNGLRFTTVPIVTLKPMAHDSNTRLLHHLLDVIQAQSGQTLSRLESYIRSPIATQRLSQYILSCIVGGRFFQSCATAFGADDLEADDNEALRHYGPWLLSEIRTIDAWCTRGFWEPRFRSKASTPVLAVGPASIPTEVLSWADSFFSDATPQKITVKLGLDKRRRAASLVPPIVDFSEVFLAMYERYEDPARDDARTKGDHYLQNPTGPLGRDRLEIGIPWISLTRYLNHKWTLQGKQTRSISMSLMLDSCNDLGIAVPITCDVGNIVFRAYRHGEEVPFADAEMQLAYEVVLAAMTSAERKSFPRLVLEKLLVLLVQVGVNQGFLTAKYDIRAGMNDASIGFHLHGAVVRIKVAPDSTYRPEKWLSQHLVERGVLAVDQHRQYRTGSPVKAAHVTRDAPERAKVLGHILGRLIKGSAGKRVTSPLSDANLVVLTSCSTPHYALGALLAELAICHSWYLERGRRVAGDALKTPQQTEAAFREVSRSNAKIGLDSACRKYVAYREGGYRRVIKECGTFLSSDPVYKTQWESYWKLTTGMTRTAEIKDTEPKIAATISVIWSALACLSLVETALEQKLVAGGRKKEGKAAATYIRWHEELVKLKIEMPTEADEAAGILEGYSAGRKVDASEVLSNAIRSFDGLESRMESTLNVAGGWLKQFGRFVPNRSYSYMLWFDLRDSKANHPDSDSSSAARALLVAQFKSSLNHELLASEREALKDNVELFFWNGHKHSTNDEKHIFATGARALDHLQKVIGKLGDLLAIHRTMACRAALVPCNFMGSDVIRFGDQEEVIGPAFFEHWSCLQKEFSARDKATPSKWSRILIVTEQLGRKSKRYSRIDIAAQDNYDGVSEVHGRTNVTPVWLGRFR